jgi:hypothetical protein
MIYIRLYGLVNVLYCYSAFILSFKHFFDSGAEICQIFCWFFGKFKKNQEDILKLTDLRHLDNFIK